MTAATGTAAPIPATVDLGATPADYSLIGAEPDDGFGREFVTGDFNGDGVDDLLTGVPRGDGPANGRLDAGEAYVILGSTALSGTRDLASQPPDLTIYGADPGDGLGSTVAAADLNGDGMDDMAIGAPNADGPANGRLDSGEVYVVFGSSSPSGTTDVSLGQQDASILGADAGDFVGRAISDADMNGDSVADLIVGSPGADGAGNGKTDSGEVYVLHGGSGLVGSKDIGASQQSVTILGIDAFDGLGSEVASGDANGDGRADLLLAADDASGPGNGRILAGEAYVLLGTASLPATIDLSSSAPALTVYGRKSGDNFSSRLALDDVTGDDVADVIIAAQSADGPGDARVDSGEAYVVFGSSGLSGTVDTASGQEDVRVYAAGPIDEISDVGVGDINGDGTGDLLLGSDDADGPGGRIDGGVGYAIYGSASLPATFDLSLDEQDVKLIAPDAQDDMSQVTSGDVNGDGGADFIIGASGGDGDSNARLNAGELFVMFGEPPPTTPVQGSQTATATPTTGAGGGGDAGNNTAQQQQQAGTEGGPDTGVGALTAGGRSAPFWTWALLASGAAGLALGGVLASRRRRKGKPQ